MVFLLPANRIWKRLVTESGIGEADVSQIINYLRASHRQRALLLYFGTPIVLFRRFVLTVPQEHVGFEEETIEVLPDANLCASGR